MRPGRVIPFPGDFVFPPSISSVVASLLTVLVTWNANACQAQTKLPEI
jgi:hypothetical protein